MFKTRAVSTLMSTALLTAFAGGAAAQSSTFHLIGTLPGTNTFSSGYGVSEDGSVVVGHSGNTFYYGSSSHAFRWTRSGGIEDLDPLAPAAGAYGVSADGQYVVGGEISGSVKAVRWGGSGSEVGGTTSIGEQLYHGGECYGISRDGRVAVGYSAESGGGGTRPHRAIRFGEDSHVEFIDSGAAGVNDPTASEALGTNSDGSVVVGWGYFGGPQQAFRWTEAGMEVITTTSGIANAVSGDGSVVVGEFTVGTARHAFRWTATTGAVDLGTLPGMRRSVAYAVSGDGSTILGKTQATTFGGAQRAFIWRADIGMQDLNEVLGAELPAGYTLTEVRSVNSTGTVFAGGSLTPTGGVEAWVAGTAPCIAPDVFGVSASRTTHTGESVDFSVSAGGFGPFTFQWRKGGQPIEGATSRELQITSTTLADSGTYDCVVTGSCGSVTSAGSTLTIVTHCPADLGQQGGVAGADNALDNNDFIAFIDAFFTGSPVVDMGSQGGVAASDGQLDNNDFIVFIDHFFAGC